MSLNKYQNFKAVRLGTFGSYLPPIFPLFSPVVPIHHIYHFLVHQSPSFIWFDFGFFKEVEDDEFAQVTWNTVDMPDTAGN